MVLSGLLKMQSHTKKGKLLATLTFGLTYGQTHFKTNLSWFKSCLYMVCLILFFIGQSVN